MKLFEEINADPNDPQGTILEVFSSEGDDGNEAGLYYSDPASGDRIGAFTSIEEIRKDYRLAQEAKQ